MPNEYNLNDNFWKWFGDSKMVRRDGKPIKFYHTTYNKFNVFEPISFKNGKAVVDYEKGREQYYFTRHRSWAENYADEEFSKKQQKNMKIMEVYLKCENPLIVLPLHKTFNQWLEWFHTKGINISAEELYPIYSNIPFISDKDYLNKRFVNEKTKNWFIDYVLEEIDTKDISFWQLIYNDTNKFKKILKKYGYDSVIIRDTNRGGTSHNLTVMVFNSNQIKSVDNNGEWSISSNNINENKN